MGFLSILECQDPHKNVKPPGNHIVFNTAVYQRWTWSGFRIANQPDFAIQNRIGLDFEKISTRSDMHTQTALSTAVKCLIRGFLGYEPHWIKYFDSMTRSGSAWIVLQASVSEMSVGLDWIRTIANCVDFWLDVECKSFQNLGSGPDLDWVNGKEMRHFVVKRLHFSNILDFTWTLHLKNILDCGWTGTEFFKIRTGSKNMTVRSSLICITSNYWGKHKRKMTFRGNNVAGKQAATIEIPHSVHALLPLVMTFNYQSHP